MTSMPTSTRRSSMLRKQIDGGGVPAGSEADVTLTIGPGQSGTMKTGLDDIAYLTAIMYSGVQVLLLAESKLGEVAKEEVSAIEEGTCLSQIASLPSTLSVTPSTVRELSSVGFGCAEQIVILAGPVWPQGDRNRCLSVREHRPDGIPRRRDVRRLVDRRDYSTDSYSKKPVMGPILGLTGSWAPGGEGLGSIKPSTVYLGGDPTGFVQSIAWQSWGGTEATGTGMSTYVAPNQITADGTEEQATIVAFDLGTCEGESAYQEVEWYFPESGQQFDPSQALYTCKMGYAAENGGAAP